MEKQLKITKLNSVLLCLQAHPDNEPDSEFADRISDIEEIIDSEKNIRLEDYVKVKFVNKEMEQASITITVKQLVENTVDDFYEWLDESEQCTSASCNNESQNFCDCGSDFEDYEFCGIEFIGNENN